MEQNLNLLQKQIYGNSLSYFLQRSFHVVNQGTNYIHNWHIDAIAEALNEVYKGNIKQLIINMPPRYLKSFCVSVGFPAWVLGKNPEKRIIVASYSQKLALSHSANCRLIMENKWFKNLFTDCVLSKNQNEKHKFSTTFNGYRFATSVGGTLTGEGGDILIVDDPHNPQEVLSDKLRQHTLDWYCNTFSSRLNDKKNGAIIIVMQRLHPEDLSGFLLEKGGWFHLNLPVYFEEETKIEVGKFSKTIKKGEYLFEVREGYGEIERIKLFMGSYIFNAQYQQKPMVNDGGLFRKEWIKYYSKSPVFENFYLSFDTALKSGINNDPTVCSVWGEYQGNYYLMEIIRKWWEYPELKKEAIKLIEKYKPQAILIEDKASGQSLIQDLKKEIKFNIIPVKVKKDKITRFASVTPFFESERIFIFENNSWQFDFEYELLSFPNSKHDDQVDSISQFLNWVREKNKVGEGVRVRKL